MPCRVRIGAINCCQDTDRNVPTFVLCDTIGARGVRSADFCKEFNARTSHLAPGTPTPVKLTIDMSNKSFTFSIKSPPTSWLLMQAAGVDKGAGDSPAGKNLIMLANAPNTAIPADVSLPTIGYKEIGSVTLKHIYEIAKIKKQDEHLKHIDLESLARSVLGTCRNIGIRVTRESSSCSSSIAAQTCKS